jgi:hypothetical protein
MGHNLRRVLSLSLLRRHPHAGLATVTRYSSMYSICTRSTISGVISRRYALRTSLLRLYVVQRPDTGSSLLNVLRVVPC